MGWFSNNDTGHSDEHVRRHEDGHARVAQALGCRVRVRGGETEILSGPPLTMAEHAAIAYGGMARAGSSGGEQDRRIAQSYINRLPRGERAAAEREAWRIARRYA